MYMLPLGKLLPRPHGGQKVTFGPKLDSFKIIEQSLPTLTESDLELESDYFGRYQNSFFSKFCLIFKGPPFQYDKVRGPNIL